MKTPGAAVVAGSGYVIHERAALDGRNTLRARARADLLVDVRTSEALAEVLAFPAIRGSRLLVLGGGSNVLFTRDWPGTILSIAAAGIRVLADDGDRVRVRVEAGENWNDVVLWSIGQGLRGLENLVLIPGRVGAAPIQNIGAYGTEVGEFVHAIEAWDRSTSSRVRLAAADCAFGYRDSVFKRFPERYVVIAVEFVLGRERALRTDYAGVADELATMGVATPTAATVAEAVARLRTRKLPDPAVLPNAGSFFKNPVLDAAEAQALVAAHPTLPAWPAGPGRSKLSAAWLIEAAGFKGAREGDAGISDRHALVLVNHGNASGAQLWAFAQRVRDGVAARFGVALEPEPLIV